MPKTPMIHFGGRPRPEPAKAPAALAPARAVEAPRAMSHEPASRLPAMRTVLGTGCSMEGKLICTGPTQLDGKVVGELLADDFLLIDRNATVIADLNVQELVVRGAVKGNIRAERRVALEETAHVEGDITAPAVEMRNGAQMLGRIDVLHDGRRMESQAAYREPPREPMHEAAPAYASEPPRLPAQSAGEPPRPSPAYGDSSRAAQAFAGDPRPAAPLGHGYGSNGLGGNGHAGNGRPEPQFVAFDDDARDSGF
jgi:cytoskeletal protein CcmA (bactofilin family)